MTTEERKVLRELRFTGGRFEETEGWLDLDVLSELLDYQKILFATIRETWLLEHQGRERLPRRFAQDFRLGISEIGAGSCSVRLEFIVPEIRIHQTERLYDAARIVDETLIAARETEPFPKEMTAKVLPMLAKWGRTLKPDESIELSGEIGRHAVFNLGCVDISPQPDESGGEMKEAKVSGVQLLKPGEDTAVMFYFVDEAFDQMTLPV